MIITKTIEETRTYIKEWKKQGQSIGFVPTMGYLHQGHGSLIKKASQDDKVIVSIFVNPMQFSPTEDLGSYPRDFEKDAAYCQSLGVDLIFYPEPDQMYEEGFCTYVNMTGLTNELCGLSRPVHFKGVCTVVMKLFHIVSPDRAYFGQKDAQQLAVIKRMVKDLNMDVQVIGCPIVREEDGLAMSSRNSYLSQKERKAALVLHQAILLGKTLCEKGCKSGSEIENKMKDWIEKEPLARIDYVKMVDGLTMERKEDIKGEMLCAIAVYIGKTRLIDNFMVNL